MAKKKPASAGKTQAEKKEQNKPKPLPLYQFGPPCGVDITKEDEKKYTREQKEQIREACKAIGIFNSDPEKAALPEIPELIADKISDEVKAAIAKRNGETVPEPEEKTPAKKTNGTKKRPKSLNAAREDVESRMISIRKEIAEAESNLEELKAEAKEEKKHLDGLNSALYRLVEELRDIRNGNYQNRLDFDQPKPEPAAPEKPQEKPKAEEPKKEESKPKHATTRLEDVSVQIDGKVQYFRPTWREGFNSLGVNTVGELIDFIQKDDLWHRKVKGVGESAVETITDIIANLGGDPLAVLQSVKG